MDEIKLTKKNFVDALQASLEVLRKGGVVAYPTETSYGLGCDFFNNVACARVYKIKQRDKSKPLPVLVPDFTYALSLAEVPPLARKYLLQYWPGPLTIVLPFKHGNWKQLPYDTLAMRVSDHQFASQMVLHFGNPVVTTSANISDKTEAFTAERIKEYFGTGPGPDLFINAGDLPLKKPTTIIQFDHEGNMKTLRQGNLKLAGTKKEKKKK